MNPALVLVLAGLVALQDPDGLPEPPPQAPTQPETPAPAKPRKAPRRKAKPSDAQAGRAQPRSPSADRDAAKAPRKAPRRRVKAEPPPPPKSRPALFEMDVKSVSMAPRKRAGTAAWQGLCSAVGGLGVVGTAGGAALLARVVDRPSGGLARPPVPVGGLMPLAAGLAAGALVSGVCVGGVGMMAERRLTAPLAAFAGWSAAAAMTLALGLTVVLVPGADNARTFAMRENAMALTIIAAAVTGPLLALLGWHLAAMAQERIDQQRYQSERTAAEQALAEDALKPRPKPPPPPEPEPAPAPPPPAPQPPAAKPAAEDDATVPADPLVAPPVVDEPAIPADPAG